MFKEAVKSFIPDSMIRALRRHKASRTLPSYENLETREVFRKIYEERAWGASDDPEQAFYSGSGSHAPDIVEPYVEAIAEFLGSFAELQDVVDIGCGDFAIGSRIRKYCRRYVACDIVEPLIEFNRTRFTSLDVEFKTLDLTRDTLPKGDIAFVRQVLQHLPNDEVIKALPQFSANFKWLVLTEHLPPSSNFVPNADKPRGPGTRLNLNSGIVLTAPPFDLPVRSSKVICRVRHEGIVQTTALELEPPR